jgi:hypothetical protein
MGHCVPERATHFFPDLTKQSREGFTTSLMLGPFIRKIAPHSFFQHGFHGGVVVFIKESVQPSLECVSTKRVMTFTAWALALACFARLFDANTIK